MFGCARVGKTVILTFSANFERSGEDACVAWWKEGNRMTDSPATRQSLLVRLRDPKDGQAWAEFVAIYSPLIDRLARAKGLQAADAADLAQEVFARWPGRSTATTLTRRAARSVDGCSRSPAT